MRLVLDTNVLIAAFIARGVCHDLFEHCKREHVLVTSKFVLDEFEEKLIRKFKVPAEETSGARTLAGSVMEWVVPAALEVQASRDPDDDWILATALAGGCECIVTGDKDLIELNPFRAIRILTPSQFWRYEASE